MRVCSYAIMGGALALLATVFLEGPFFGVLGALVTVPAGMAVGAFIGWRDGRK